MNELEQVCFLSNYKGSNEKRLLFYSNVDDCNMNVSLLIWHY